MQSSAPYLVTALLGAIGWGIVHVVDEMHTAPSVEYDMRRENSGRIIVTIENLSRAHRFMNLKFGLAVRGSNAGKFSHQEIEAVPPAFEGDVPGGTLLGEGGSVEFTIPDLQPHARLELRANYSGEGRPTFRLLSADADIELLERDRFTFIVKHELGFIVLFGLVSFGLILVLVWLGSEGRDEKPPILEE